MRPVAPPVAEPVAPPVARPLSGPPVVAPATPPTLKPAAPPALAPVSGPSRDAREPDDARGRSERETRGGGRGGGGGGGRGMSVGAKVGLVTFVVAFLAMAAVVVPARNAAPTASGDDEFVAVGRNAVAALATGYGGDSAAQSGGGGVGKADLKAIEDMIADLDKQLRMPNDDPDEKQKKQNQRNGLVALANRLAGSSGSAPVPGAAKPLRIPGPIAGYEPKAGWILSLDRSKAIAESPGAGAYPTPPATTTAIGDYAGVVQGVTARVFWSQVLNVNGAATGWALLAMAEPKASAAGGGGGGTIPLVLLFVGPLLVSFLAFGIASGHAKPLRDLAREIDRLGSSGDPARRIPARGPDANAIARGVERMVANLKFRDQHQMADLGEVVSKEQETTAQIHQSLMPKDPPRIAGYEVETLFKPGFEIGGDHFDYFRIDDSHLGVILMDTSVRGIPAALVMAMARAYVRSEAPGVLSPAEVLMKVNRLLAADLPPGQYVTALYAVIDTASGTARIASAGHLPLIVYRHALGKTAIVNPEGIALGLDVGLVFDRAIQEAEVPIGVGDRIVLHTDGAMKVQSEVGEEFGEQRLYQTIRQEAPKNSQAFVNFVGSAIDQFHAGAAQNDDITISTVKRLR
jgi:serine phosphatase RsbU (regulator of sigma subunit)